jgi:hypothetical protein
MMEFLKLETTNWLLVLGLECSIDAVESVRLELTNRFFLT